LEEIKMAYNHGRKDRKWRIWKEAEEKVLRECGVDEVTIEKIRTDDRADFNSNRRFYRWTSDFEECLEEMAGREK
jgi:RNA polymerase sigma-70 factor (ECF subfamily)